MIAPPGRSRRILEAALALDGLERAAFLDRCCARDRSMRAEVETLLRHGRELGDFLARPLVHTWLEAQSGDDGETALPFDRLGDFRLLAPLGSGGMAQVFLAEQDQPRRRVALKLVRAELAADPEFRRRFENEIEMLGRLEHHGIARLYQAGTAATPRGPRSYFAMELVEGRTILRHAEEERLGLRERLALLAKVADAVHHAHQRGIVHRDLKPENVLVEPGGRAKVLDFGIARCSDGDVKATTLATAEHSIVGTLAYMSPEQAAGDLRAVDSRSDVYALGALLYELLSGRLPCPVAGLPVHEAARVVIEREPESLGALRRELRGDIETIVAKALEKERERRYASAAALADDIRRHLRDEPVEARPPSRAYLLRKFARRNRALVAGLAAVFAALILGLAGTTWQAVRARIATQAAVEEGMRASRLAEEAQASAELARARAAELLRLSDLQRLRTLELRADELWPAQPERIPELERWMADASELLARLPEHEAALARLRSTAPQDELSEAGLAWWCDTLGELVTDLAAFADPETGSLRGLSVLHGWGVERRLAFARRLESAARDPEVRARWAEAIRSISDRELCPRYEGLVIAPQTGLLPIGRDPGSGLWEFAHLMTGTAPERDSGTGRLRLESGFGLVLVLVPGGTFWMGAQKLDPDKPGYDSQAADLEGPVREVTLPPYFISKYEMTRGQWKRVTGETPSYSEENEVGADSDFFAVDNVLRNESRILNRLALELPTEEQWERAARAGTQTPWWTGATRESLIGAANLAEHSRAAQAAGRVAAAELPEFEEGAFHLARVDHYPPSPFGLHDVHGGLWEAAHGPMFPTRAMGEERSTTSVIWARGGCYNTLPKSARCSARPANQSTYQPHTLGIRPARALDP